MAEQLGIAATRHKPRQYSATVFINAGVDMRLSRAAWGMAVAAPSGSGTQVGYQKPISGPPRHCSSDAKRTGATKLTGPTMTGPPKRTTDEVSDLDLKDRPRPSEAGSAAAPP
jgi:hypothetical protein